MALPINVEDLIHQRKVERTRIEYKADWNPEPIIHTLTAFANDFVIIQHLLELLMIQSDKLAYLTDLSGSRGRTSGIVTRF